MNPLRYLGTLASSVLAWFRSDDALTTVSAAGATGSIGGAAFLTAETVQHLPQSGGLLVMLVGLMTSAMPFVARGAEAWAKGRETKVAEAKAATAEALARVEELERRLDRCVDRCSRKSRWMIAATKKCDGLELPEWLGDSFDSELSLPPAVPDTEEHVAPPPAT